MYKILGYFVHKDDDKLNPLTAMVVIDADNKLYGYCPKEQHFDLDRGYLNECMRITKEEYLKASKGLYTPLEYLTAK